MRCFLICLHFLLQNLLHTKFMQCLIWSYLGADLKKAVEQKELAHSLCANVLEHNDKLTSELQLLQSALPVTATQTTQTGTFEDWWSANEAPSRVGQLNTTRRMSHPSQAHLCRSERKP